MRNTKRKAQNKWLNYKGLWEKRREKREEDSGYHVLHPEPQAPKKGTTKSKLWTKLWKGGSPRIESIANSELWTSKLWTELWMRLWMSKLWKKLWTEPSRKELWTDGSPMFPE